MDVVRGDLVEKELTAFIENRDRQRGQTEGERRAEEAWKDSERRHNARIREENRAAWCEYHQGQAERLRAVFEPLIARHEDEAAKLMEAQPKGA